MSFQFSDAVKERMKLRLAITGVTGGGKTYSALAIAKAIAERENTRFCVIDTEHDRAKLYADQFTIDGKPFAHGTLAAPFSPDRYIEALHAVERAGFGVVVIDSLSHAWFGPGGVLEMVDEETERRQAKSKFTSGWRYVTPEHNKLIEAVLGSPIHLIATMRVKQEYAVNEQDRSVTKLGMAPVQRDNVEYEFDIILDMHADNRAVVTKSRMMTLTGKTFLKPGADLGRQIWDWLNSGAEAAEPTPQPEPTKRQPSRIDQPPPMTQPDAIQAMVNGVNAEKRDLDSFTAYVESKGLTLGDACRRLSIANTPRGLREALKEIKLDALKDRLDASMDADYTAAQPALDGMPAVERERPEAAAGAH